MFPDFDSGLIFDLVDFMTEQKKISVELLADREVIVPAVPSATAEKMEDYFKAALLEKMNNKLQSEWAIKFEERGYGVKPIYAAYIYVRNQDDFHPILGEILTLPEIQLEKGYLKPYSEWNDL